jgi:DNA-binding transcriptional regulator GbsR (MarR family)
VADSGSPDRPAVPAAATRPSKSAILRAQVSGSEYDPHVTDAASVLEPTTRRPASPMAEEIRIRLADAWGEMGAAWGVAPAIARVHAYLMSRQGPLTEREVREALNLSHRAASLALAEAEAWGLVERVAEPRRVGRRGPAGTAYQAVGDHWRWFGRVVAERKVREGDPIIVVLEGIRNWTLAATRSGRWLAGPTLPLTSHSGRGFIDRDVDAAFAASRDARSSLANDNQLAAQGRHELDVIAGRSHGGERALAVLVRFILKAWVWERGRIIGQ